MTSERSLPDGWRWVRFGDVVRQVKDKVDPESADLERYVGGSHMDTDDLRLRRWGEIGHDYLGPAFHMRFRPGQVLYGSRRTYLRKVAVPEFEGICANTTFVLEPSSDDLLPEFLPHVMSTERFHEHSIQQSKGSVNPYINFRDLAWYEFGLPTAATQRQFIGILRSVQSLIDRYAELEHAALTVAAALCSDLLEQDFDGRVKPLGSVAHVEMGRAYPSSDYTSEGIRLLRPGNIAASGLVEWSDDSTVHLPPSYMAEKGSVELREGDIVMNLTAQSLEDGFLGRACVAGEGDRALVNQRIARITATEGSTEYLFRVLQHPRFRRRVAASAKGSKVKHLYWQDLATFEVPMPSASRAAEVTAHIRAAELTAWGSKAALESSERMYKALRTKLLAGESSV